MNLMFKIPSVHYAALGSWELVTSELLANAENSVEHLGQGLLPGFDGVNARRPSVPGRPRWNGRRLPSDGPRLIQRKVCDLRPWPGFEQARRSLAPQKLYAMAEAGEAVFREPILVTHDGIILDGHARWIIARQQGRETLECFEHIFPTEEKALRFFLQRHTVHSDSLTPFSRVVLALELKPVLRERARGNQQTRSGGQLLSTLTEGRGIEVRQEIASLAQVSTGNVTKVAQTLSSACPELLAALHQGEVSIHRAHQWSKLTPRKQRDILVEWSNRKDIRQTAQRMVSRHKSKAVAPLTAADLLRRLAVATDQDLGGIDLHIIKHPGKHLLASQELVDSLHIETSGSASPARRGRG